MTMFVILSYYELKLSFYVQYRIFSQMIKLFCNKNMIFFMHGKALENGVLLFLNKLNWYYSYLASITSIFYLKHLKVPFAINIPFQFKIQHSHTSGDLCSSNHPYWSLFVSYGCSTLDASASWSHNTSTSKGSEKEAEGKFKWITINDYQELYNIINTYIRTCSSYNVYKFLHFRSSRC